MAFNTTLVCQFFLGNVHIVCHILALYCDCSCLYFITVHAHSFLKSNKAHNFDNQKTHSLLWVNPLNVVSNPEL